MSFIRTRSTETTTHNYHGMHYYQLCPGIIKGDTSGVDPVYVRSSGSGGIRTGIISFKALH